jgi:hypothetical protein
MLVLLVPALAAAQGASQAKIETYGLKIDGRSVDVLFRITDRATGRAVQGIQSGDIKLLEDGKPIATQVKLAESRTDAANPSSTVALKPSANGLRPWKAASRLT